MPFLPLYRSSLGENWPLRIRSLFPLHRPTLQRLTSLSGSSLPNVPSKGIEGGNTLSLDPHCSQFRTRQYLLPLSCVSPFLIPLEELFGTQAAALLRPQNLQTMPPMKFP